MCLFEACSPTSSLVRSSPLTVDFLGHDYPKLKCYADMAIRLFRNLIGQIMGNTVINSLASLLG